MFDRVLNTCLERFSCHYENNWKKKSRKFLVVSSVELP